MKRSQDKLYRYPSEDDVVILQHHITRDENQRSRATYAFLNTIKDPEEKKWWILMMFPLLRAREREKLFAKG